MQLQKWANKRLDLFLPDPTIQNLYILPYMHVHVWTLCKTTYFLVILLSPFTESTKVFMQYLPCSHSWRSVSSQLVKLQIKQLILSLFRVDGSVVLIVASPILDEVGIVCVVLIVLLKLRVVRLGSDVVDTLCVVCSVATGGERDVSNWKFVCLGVSSRGKLGFVWVAVICILSSLFVTSVLVVDMVVGSLVG